MVLSLFVEDLQHFFRELLAVIQLNVLRRRPRCAVARCFRVTQGEDRLSTERPSDWLLRKRISDHWFGVGRFFSRLINQWLAVIGGDERGRYHLTELVNALVKHLQQRLFQGSFEPLFQCIDPALKAFGDLLGRGHAVIENSLQQGLGVFRQLGEFGHPDAACGLFQHVASTMHVGQDIPSGQIRTIVVEQFHHGSQLANHLNAKDVPTRQLHVFADEHRLRGDVIQKRVLWGYGFMPAAEFDRLGQQLVGGNFPGEQSLGKEIDDVRQPFEPGGSVAIEGTTFTFLADHRRTPYLQTTNALFGTPNASLDHINTANESLLRDQAKAVTATSDLFLIGALHAVSKDWQLGGDVRLNKISGTSASNCLLILPGTSTLFLNPNATTDAPCSLQAQPGTGNIWTYTAQAIGANFPWENNTFVVNASYIDNQAYRGQSVTLNSLVRLGTQWQFDTFLILYHQTDSFQVELYRVTPTIRMDYRFFKSWTVEGSGGVEKTYTTSPTQKDSTTRQFFFLGLRWDSS